MLGSTARAIRSMYATASTGYSPTAVSPESITADVPSRIAFATSLASARVGSGEWIIVSSICVAVITVFPSSSARWMIRFCTSGTSAGPISTPRSPRATITASVSARIVVEDVHRLRLLDLRDHVRVRAGLLEQRAKVADVGRRADEGERDEVDSRLERPVEVVHVLAGQRRDRERDAREVDALVRRDGAADDDGALARPLCHLVDAQPNEAVVDEDVVPRLEHVPDHRGRDGQLAVGAASSAQTVISSPARRTTGSASSPIRSFGPCRSAMSATGRPRSAAISRTSHAFWECSACVPCERLKRDGVDARLEQRTRAAHASRTPARAWRRSSSAGPSP